MAFESEVGDAVGLITNMSTWQDVASLAAFVVGPMHAAIMRRRREWFLPFREAYTTCWWVPAGHRPSVGEAEDRLQLLRRLGPTGDSFVLRPGDLAGLRGTTQVRRADKRRLVVVALGRQRSE